MKGFCHYLFLLLDAVIKYNEKGGIRSMLILQQG